MNTGTHHDNCDDCRYWRLTLAQGARYHARLARYHARRGVQFADNAERLARRAFVFACISAAFLALSLFARMLA